ncbi:hypothetical protein HZS_2360 [Henneguya salminicola]|nr:hypothetical protein HZS_2360 [Henneguya salminicola]
MYGCRHGFMQITCFLHMEVEKVLVKLYILNEENVWEDKCTGCLFFYEIENQENDSTAYKLVISEDSEAEQILYEFDLNSSIKYTRQQDTLISWEESDKEFAISFQSASICQITYETIQKSLKNMNLADGKLKDNLTTEISDLNNSKIEELSDFPEISHNNLSEIATYFVDAPNNMTMARREQLAAIVDQCDWIPKLVEIFQASESLEDVQSLTNLFIITKAIFSFTRFTIFEVLLHDDYLMDIIGILEYNPALTVRIHHREILLSSKLLEIIPFSNPTLKDLIIHTHRLQYLQDVLLPAPAIFEERGSYLSSFVFFRKNEIMDMIFDDKTFLPKLFSLLNEGITDNSIKENLLRLIVEICNFSRILQLEQKELFMSKLLNYDVLQSLEKLKDLSGPNIQSSIIDVLFRVSDTHPDIIRQGLLASQERKCDLIVYIAEQIIKHPESNSSLLAVQVMKVVLDVSNCSTKEQSPKNTNNQFLTSFYSSPINFLMSPLFKYTEQTSPLKENSFIEAIALENILDILLICITHHTYHIKNYLFKNDTLKNVAILVNSKYAFLCHSAIRIIRRTLANSDEFYWRYLSKERILDSIIDSLILKHNKYNIVNSAIIDLFEYLRVSNTRVLCIELVERHRSTFDSITYVPTFKKLITFVDQFLSDRQTKSRTTFLVKPQSLFSSYGNTSEADELEEDGRENSWIEEDDLKDENASKFPSDSPDYGISCLISEENGIDELPPIKPKFTLPDDSVTLRPKINNAGIKISLKRTASSSTSEENTKHNAGMNNGPLVDYPDDDHDDNLPPCDDFVIEDNEAANAPSNKRSKVVDIS